MLWTWPDMEKFGLKEERILPLRSRCDRRLIAYIHRCSSVNVVVLDDWRIIYKRDNLSVSIAVVNNTNAVSHRP
ncbi:hypothetical protein BK026_17160 [Alteromonas sp. V450]|nr:hypothetical protein BK026_17160 [Alteromonas sp. V450]